MRVAVMQPYIFPYIGYFQLISAVDVFVVYDDVAFINKGWINRNTLLSNGKPLGFTVPLVGASQNRLIRDIEVVGEPKWRSNLLKTIRQAYGKAPQFETVFLMVEEVLESDYTTIGELATLGLQKVCEQMEIQTPIRSTSTLYNNSHLKAQERILDICQQEKATEYINPIGGVSLYDTALFASHGIKLHFLKSTPYSYPQPGEFVPWLSIIDVLMYTKKEDYAALLSAYTLV